MRQFQKFMAQPLDRASESDDRRNGGSLMPSSEIESMEKNAFFMEFTPLMVRFATVPLSALLA